MRRGCGHIVLTIGLVLCASLAYSQDQPDAALESEPISEPRQAEGAAAGEQNAQSEDRPPPDYTSAFERIEAAIRDLISEVDEAESQRQENREIADLQAQNDMALWAKGMFWATVAAVIVTGMGVALVRWTLYHTRRAADSARDMVDEAKLATAAANETVNVTRDVGQRQIRAYVISDPNFEWGYAYQDRPDNIVGYNFNMKWRNCGLTPARRCHSRVSLGVFDELMSRDFSYADKVAPEITDTNYIGPNQIILSRVGGFKLGDADVVQRGEKHLYIWGWTEYDDVFGGIRRRTEFCYRIRISWDEDRKIVFIPIVSGPFNGADEDCHHQTKT